MNNKDYLCPVCGELLTDDNLYCENCQKEFEPWECANTLKTLDEDYREQKAVNRFYGLED